MRANINILCLIAGLALLIPPHAHGQYMSMFNASNMAAVNIAGTASVNAAIGKSAKIASRNIKSKAGLAPKAAGRYRPIRFTVDPALRAKVMQSYLDRARKMDRAEGDALARAFSQTDQFAVAAGNLRLYGLDINDLADVVTAYWAVNWGAVHQSGRPSKRQVQGLQKQIRQTLAGSSLAGRQNGAVVQQYADDMLMRLLLIDGAVEQGLREGNREQLQTVGTYVRQSSYTQMGIDLGVLNLTSKGLVPF